MLNPFSLRKGGDLYYCNQGLCIPFLNNEGEIYSNMKNIHSVSWQFLSSNTPLLGLK